jgi:hypothetical protein
MSTDDENYEDFVKRYRAAKGEPAAGPKFSAVNKQLVLMIVVGVAFYLFSSAISVGMDEAAAAAQDTSEQMKPHQNPWSKD